MNFACICQLLFVNKSFCMKTILQNVSKTGNAVDQAILGSPDKVLQIP